MQVIKRDGTKVPYDSDKIVKAVNSAFEATGEQYDSKELELFVDTIPTTVQIVNDGVISVETIQNMVENWLMMNKYYKTAKAYILYREEHKNTRFLKSRIDYIQNYIYDTGNAASSSETDANSNVVIKNVANLEGEVYKETNRKIQRMRMKHKLQELFPEIADKYVEDLENNIIYTHDEASTPTLKYYCEAVTLFPLMLNGTGSLDGVTPSAPNDIASFSGQVTNAIFLLSSQCKGAVAVGDYFIALNYYVRKDFGNKWFEKLNDVVTKTDTAEYTVLHYIRKGMKTFIYGVNQPAGNRSYNSPFTNVNYCDSVYFESLFGDFYYPDGTKPLWKEIDILQRMFMQLHRELRLIKPLTFPVSTIAMVYDDDDYIDNEYKELCAEEWAKGGSFFCYNSNNPTSLSSCCRVLNEIEDNTFSSTTGMTGVMTGSCNVITLNINRIVQNFFKVNNLASDDFEAFKFGFKPYLVEILERVYKYHITYKTMLYDMEDAKMFTSSNAGYIYMKKLYSTIGIIGYFEAAKFLGLSTTYNKDYIEFLQLILGTIKEQNKLHAIHDKKRPFKFNSEAVPGENLGVRFYQKDKADGYIVPEDQNLYNCYFYNPWDESSSIFDKLKLHGREISTYTDGGQAAHLNLDSHLSKEQYLKILDFARKSGSNYFTFNIPMSECADCGHTVNAPIKECPKCKSEKIKYWTRIIG